MKKVLVRAMFVTSIALAGGVGMVAPAQASCLINAGTCSSTGQCTVNAGTCHGECEINTGYCSTAGTCLINAGGCYNLPL